MYCHSDLALGAARAARGGMRAPASAVLGLVQRRALAAPGAVLVASETSREWVAPHTAAPALTAPLGVRPLRLPRRSPRRGAQGPPACSGEALLLYAGRLSSEKRVHLLAPTLARMGRPAVLAVAGAGVARSRVERAARRLGVEGRLRLLGHVASRGELARLMATADCFVHANPAEPFGLAPLEALAAGCRVVAPDAAGTAETLGGRGAVLVAPGHPAALAAGVERALRGPRPRPALDDLRWDRTFQEEWEVYRRLAS